MSDIGAAGNNVYSVAGYKEGDRIGAGVVVDPAKLTKGNNDTKLVHVDLNLNDKVDNLDDQIVVKLPPKGVVPVNWNGVARLEGGGKTGFILKDSVKPMVTGAILGGTAGLLASFPHVAKNLSGDPLAASIALPLVGMGAGAAIGAMSAPEGKGGRNALIGMGIGGAAATAITYSVNGVSKGLLVVGALALAGAAVAGTVSAVGKSQELNEDKQKARAASVPDMVPPKQILNQYLNIQTDNK